MNRLRTAILAGLMFLTASAVSMAKGPEKMSFKVGNDGKVTVRYCGKTYIDRSNIGLVLLNGELMEPVAAKRTGSQIKLYYPGCEVILEMRERERGSVRLEVTSLPDAVDAFIFGPYECPDAVEIGDAIGAAWMQDGSVACIQSLNPKTQGEIFIHRVGERGVGGEQEAEICYSNEPLFTLPSNSVAGRSAGKIVLSCSAINYTRPHRIYGGNTMAEAIPAPEGGIEGAAIVLTCASDASDLLGQIGRMEVEEGLPHPTIDGEWAKTSPHATDLYLVFNNGDIESQIRMAERAGVHWIYFSDPFKSWGHFDINTDLYPGGIEQFKQVISEAKKHDINIGFHTLSNFIHTHDPYVTPVPHKELLSFDPTPIAAGISAEDKEIRISEALGYEARGSVGAVRIGDELITYESFDKDALTLRNCVRGAFGTVAAAHAKGDTLAHMSDHGYGTLFPTVALRDEMADNIGRLISECGIRRMSFDGLEGCRVTGHGDLGTSAFVQRVMEHCGNDLICDASTRNHYRWHAHSYFNWGEPWYDFQRYGGMYRYRVKNSDFFDRNLLPRMLGWYGIFSGGGRFESSMPEVVETILSHMVAYNAGMCIVVSEEEGSKLDTYLDMMKLWQDFRFSVDVPEEVRERMCNERSDWHLERKDGKWLLSELFLEDYDMAYCDRAVTTESGTTGYGSGDQSLRNSSHRSLIVLDSSTPGKGIPAVTEPLHCRIRVGTPEDSGQLKDLTFSGGWYGSPVLSFKLTANAGEYLEYRGGKQLYRYDSNYNLIETIDGEGNELYVDGNGLCAYTLDYDTVGDGSMVLMLKYIRTIRQYEF